MTAEPFDTVLVVDFGAQYAQLIARRVRECNVYSEIVPHDISIEEIKSKRPVGLILSGGPQSVYEPGAPALNPALLELGIPVLGICYGQQAMTHALGGKVAKTGTREYGKTDLRVLQTGRLFDTLPEEQTVWMSHGDAVQTPPDGFTVTAQTDPSPCAAFEDPARGFYGVQFHPEVAHTPKGTELLKNFLYGACDARPTWTRLSIIEEAIEQIRAQVGDEKVVCGLSGGVDSSVAAALVHRAIGDQLTCVFVDHGLMRAGEAEQVEHTFRSAFQVNLIHVKAEDRFLSKLAGVTDPEDKRITIGHEFIRTFEDVARTDLQDARFLVQGTLYPDVIESGTKDAAKIKSHHNV
ncbi:MAG: glutamine-hydrolyzing GMP synthase, partial [Actinomycetota bacterium]